VERRRGERPRCRAPAGVPRLDAGGRSRAERWHFKASQPVKSIKTGLWRACDRGGVRRCASTPFRHTAASRMRCSGVPPWEVAAQLGHSVGKEYAITERYAFYSPDYLSRAVEALDGLVRLVADRPVAGQSDEKSEQGRSSSGVEQRIRNAWAGGSNPSCGTIRIQTKSEIHAMLL
jgi:hypothetical protein